jgi:hypothetical protein
VAAALKVGDYITLGGVLVAGVGLTFAGLQLKAAQTVAKGQFLLSLGPPFRDYVALHARLRAGGQWWASEERQPSNEDWAELEQYMGLFERMWILVQDNSLDLGVVDRLYAYRLGNIVKNDHIRGLKLEREASGWTDFIRLWHALEAYRSAHGKQALYKGAPQPAS